MVAQPLQVLAEGFQPPSAGGGLRPPSAGGGGPPTGIGGPTTLQPPSAGGGGAPPAGGGGPPTGIGGPTTLQPPSAGGGGAGAGAGGNGPTLQPPSAGGGQGGGNLGGGDVGGGISTEPSGQSEVDLSSKPWLQAAAEQFKQGNEVNAFQYLYGHILTQPGGLEEFPIQWVEGLNAPRVAIRFGLGIEYEKPAKLTVRPPVIGDPPPPPGRNPRTGNGGAPVSPNDPSPYEGLDNSTIPGFMYYYTGDVGDYLLDHYNRRRYEEQMFGEILKDMPSNNLRSVLPEQSPNRRRPGVPNDFREEDLVVDPSRSNGGGGANDDEVAQVYGTLQPGMMLLGRGSRSELKERAEAIGLDVLIIVKLNVQVRGDGKGIGKARLQVITVADGKNHYSSRTLSHPDVYKLRERNDDKDRDPVNRLINDYFSEVGESMFAVSAMPEKPEDLQDQIAQRIADKPDNPLPLAIEILNYRQLAWISDDSASQHLTSLFDESVADALMVGSPQEKQDAILQWLPGQYSVDLSE